MKSRRGGAGKRLHRWELVHLRGQRIRLIRSAAVAVALAGLATATGAGTALAGTAVTEVTPATTTPGSSVTFYILCGTTAHSATLSGTTLGLPEQIPMSSEGETGYWASTVTLPSDIQPATYTPSMDCDNGVSGTVTLVVTPSGAPVTGDGTTTTATGGPLTAAGAGLAALGGVLVVMWAWRRHNRSGSGA